MLYFYTVLKHQKILTLCDIFRGYRNVTLGKKWVNMKVKAARCESKITLFFHSHVEDDALREYKRKISFLHEIVKGDELVS